AREHFYDMLPVLKFIVTGGLPATVKAGITLRGLDVGDPRLPVLPLSQEKEKELSGYMKKLSVTDITA
ncbi:MAG: dihydrodipicolinate synthase family protein, partial [Litorimonas sp.]